MADEVRDAVGRAERDPDVVGIVLTGAGKGFCAGADMNGLSTLSGADGGAARCRAQPHARRRVDQARRGRRGATTCAARTRTSCRCPSRSSPRSTAPVAGMGVPIVLSCDLRFMNEATVLTTSFAQRGLVAEWGLSWLLDPARRAGARPRPAVLGPPGARRRGRPHRPRQPGAAGRGGAAGGAGLRPRARPVVVAGVDGGDEAAGVHRAARRPRRRRAQGDRADGRELQPARLRRGRASPSSSAATPSSRACPPPDPSSTWSASA